MKFYQTNFSVVEIYFVESRRKKPPKKWIKKRIKNVKTPFFFFAKEKKFDFINHPFDTRI